MTFKNLFPLSFFFWPCLLFSQDTLRIISTIDNELQSKVKTISEVLSDTGLMYLHYLTPFREVIKKNATADPIIIVAKNEPGVKIVVNGTVTNNSGKPLSNVLIYFYQTSDKGWYSDTAVHILIREGDHRHARIFGYVKTNAEGKFQIMSIRPNGYPKSDLAAHIHIQMWKEDGKLLLGIPGELQFDDDIRMTEQRRQKSVAEGFLIAKNEGTKEEAIYNYIIKSKSE